MLVDVGVCMPHHMFKGQGTTLWGRFSLSNFPWVLEVELRLTDCRTSVFTEPTHPSPCLFLKGFPLTSAFTVTQVS